MKKFNSVCLLTFFAISFAQPLRPEAEEKIYYAPFPVALTLDGNFDDWENIPTVTLSEYPKPSPVEGENGPVTFALAADETNLYIYAAVTDKTVLAGTKDTEYWREDSIEFYLNATGDLAITQYQPGVSQMTITPLNIGRSPDETLVGGIQGSDAGAKAFVVKTENGYALELSVPLINDVWNITPQHGTTLGFEVQLNGSSGDTQDAQLNWIYRATDTGHPSNNPSLFGQLVFYEVGQAEKPQEQIMVENVNVVAEVPLQPSNTDGSGIPADVRTRVPNIPNLAEQPRNPWLWPFSSDSIWNMPIGSNAEYVPANLPKQGHVAFDQEYFFIIQESDPEYPIYTPGSWTKRCDGTVNTQFGEMTLQFPRDVVLPDATENPYSTPNNVATLLQPDGRTLIQIEPLTRCEKDGPLYGYIYTEWQRDAEGYVTQDLYGEGIEGTHFGSGLSGLGGSIRLGELTSEEPIRHALKLNLWGKQYLYYGEDVPGFRWPANRHDTGAEDKDSFNGYGGTNPSLVMGSLLAIPPTTTPGMLGLKTDVGYKLFYALQDYGAYVVDNSAWDAVGLVGEVGVEKEVQDFYGYSLTGDSGDFYSDINAIMQVLQIVDNNSPETVGGGGEPRQELAPALLEPQE
jgi:hypothetical protein